MASFHLCYLLQRDFLTQSQAQKILKNPYSLPRKVSNYEHDAIPVAKRLS